MEEQIFGDAKISLHEKNDRIIVVKYIENWYGEDNLKTAEEVVSGVKSYGAQINGSNAMLAIVPTLYTEKSILNYYQNADFGEVARAMVIRSFAAKIVGNMYLKAFKHSVNENGRHVPTKLFTDEDHAIEWLNKQFEKSDRS
ncbi:MAG: hypothetical protein AB8E82_13910 [Aureispira sp.]